MVAERERRKQQKRMRKQKQKQKLRKAKREAAERKEQEKKKEEERMDVDDDALKKEEEEEEEEEEEKAEEEKKDKERKDALKKDKARKYSQKIDEKERKKAEEENKDKERKKKIEEKRKDEIELEKAQSVVDFAMSMIDFSDSAQKQNLFHEGYLQAISRLEDVRNKIDGKKKIEQKIKEEVITKDSVRRSPTTTHSLPAAETLSPLASVEYVEASTVDGSALSADQVECYFANFGPLTWCMQSCSSPSTVLFSFTDSAIIKTVLEFNHRIEKKALRLQPKGGGVGSSEGPSQSIASNGSRDDHWTVSSPANASSGSRFTSSFAGEVEGNVNASSPEELAKYIDQLANSVMR